MSRRVLLTARPDGLPADEHFTVEEGPTPEPGEGEIAVAVSHVSLDPAMRGWMRDVPSYVPPVGIGEVMRAGAVGEVIASRHPRFRKGDHVVGMFGVAEHAVSDGSGVVTVDLDRAPAPRYLGALGMPGMTAYFGLLDIGQPQEGDTVVVSGAAGAVGSLVGQIAKLRGCRAIGIAGGPDKCRHVVDDLGFDACIDYRNEDVGAKLREHAPDRVNVYFDNVGNPILDIVLTRIAMNARIVICGAIAQYNAERASGPANYMMLLVMRARMEGFIVFDFAKRYREAAEQIGGWLAEGKLAAREDVVRAGVDEFPAVLRRLFDGDNVGKLVLEVQA